jgi:hypothetical protein
VFGRSEDDSREVETTDGRCGAETIRFFLHGKLENFMVRTLIRCVLVLLPLAVGSAHAATYHARAFAGPASDIHEYSPTPALAQAHLIDSSLPALADVRADARVDAGGIHLQAISHVSVELPQAVASTQLSSMEAIANGIFSDSFTIVTANPALMGSVGLARVGIAVDGGVGGSGAGGGGGLGWSGWARWEAHLSFSNPGSWSGGQSYSTDAQHYPQSFIDPFDSNPLMDYGFYGFWVPVTFGTPLGLELRAEVTSSAGAAIAAGYTGSVNAVFYSSMMNTVGWGGILELRDANGGLVTDYSARSDSLDFDYRQPYASAVPELPVWSSLLLGGALLIARRARADRR